MLKKDRQLLNRFVKFGLGAHAGQSSLQKAITRTLEELDEATSTAVRVSHHVCCSVCRYPYILRRAILVGAAGKIEWVFQPDCPNKAKKCKGSQPVPLEGP